MAAASPSSPFSSTPSSLIEELLLYVPQSLTAMAAVSKCHKRACEGKERFFVEYFRILTDSLGEERVTDLIGQISEIPKENFKAKFVDLIKCSYACVKSFGGGKEKLKQEDLKGMISAAQLGELIKLIDEEEARNLSLIVSRLPDEVRTFLWQDLIAIQAANPKKTRTELAVLENRAVRLRMLEITPALASMVNGTLNLANLGLTCIPKGLARFTNITSLILDCNAICEVPSEVIGALTHLENLELQNNKIHTLPAVIETLPKLKNLRLHGNPIARVSPLPEIINRMKSKGCLIYYHYNKGPI